ncbi:MAG: tetratricopeptide repeat protein [Vampirovibrionales bacterium]
MAAIHIKRGQYFLNQGHAEAAVNDFRRASYYLEAGWPLGESYSANQQRNRDITKQNLAYGYEKLGNRNPSIAQHLEWASALRQQGAFEPALAEYHQILLLEQNHVGALQACGDLFVVMNQPALASRALKQLLAAQMPNPPVETLARLAHAENLQGDTDAAVDHLNQATAIDPTNTRVLGLLEKIWRKELQFDTTNPVVHANLGSVFQKQGQFDKALKAYTNAEQLLNQPVPGSTPPANAAAIRDEIALNRGTLYQQQKNFAMARQAFEQVLQKNPQQPRALFLLASLHYELHQPQDALNTLEQLLAVHPNDQAVHQQYFSWLKETRTHDWPEALMAYGNQYPQQEWVQTSVAEALHAQQKPADAVPFYQRAVSLSPNNAVLLANYGGALQACGRTDDAVAVLKKAQQLDSDSTAIQDLLTKTQNTQWQATYTQAAEALNNHQLDEANRLYALSLQQAQKAGSTVPKEFYLAYGASLQQANRFDDALKQYQTVIQMDAKDGTAYYYRGTVYHQQRAYGKARADYTQALTLTGLDSATTTATQQSLQQLNTAQINEWIEQATAAYQSKNHAKALALLTEANQIGSSQAPTPPASLAMIAYTKGLVLSDQKQYAPAIAAYQQAVNHDPDLAEAYYALGAAYELTAKPSDAKKAYQQYVTKALARGDSSTDESLAYAQARIQQLP